jgi:hypothetical protein
MITKVATAIGITCLIIFGIAGVGLLLAFPIKWTWNATIPYLFGLPTISWGKAWCLNFLCGCLIKYNHTTTGRK